MGGYGSGRPATRRLAESSYPWGTYHIAQSLAELRRRRDAGEDLRHLGGQLRWTVRGREDATVEYVVCASDREPFVLVAYNADGVDHVERIDLVELPSNLGRGQLVYWRCRCGARARVLYYVRSLDRWRCRRCYPVVYLSSRESDRRISRFLAGEGPMVRGDPRLASLNELFLTLRGVDRQRTGHGGQGRTWSPARRAAQRRRE